MPRSDDYKAAIALAVAELQQINPKRLENRTGAQHFVRLFQRASSLPYFGQARRITWPEVSIAPGNGAGRNFPPRSRSSSSTTCSTPREICLPAGPSISARSRKEGFTGPPSSPEQKPLLSTFGHDLDLYVQGGGESGRRTPAPGRYRRPVYGLAPGAHHPCPVWRETRNSPPRPPSFSMKPSPSICPPKISPPSPAPRSTA